MSSIADRTRLRGSATLHRRDRSPSCYLVLARGIAARWSWNAMRMQTLETSRLVLRPFTRADEEIHRLVFADPNVAVPFCGGTRTLAETREWLVHRAWQARNDEFGYWALVRKEDGTLLGLVALQPYVAEWIVWKDDPEPRHNGIEVEYAYALGREHWGNGYATEAGHAVIGYAFEYLGLPRIAYAVDATNRRSVAVMRRLGFVEAENLHASAPGSILGVLENRPGRAEHA
jgi:RimJ/RimL family protein N-acetyltransferase